VAWGAAALFLAVAAYLLLRPAATAVGPETRATLIRSSITVPESIYVHAFGSRSGRPMLSPDGRCVIFAGITPDGGRSVYLRRLDDMSVRPVNGTGGGANPFWSPDGKWIGFFAEGKLKKVDLVSGSPVTICTASNERGGTWNEEGTIVYTPDFQTGLFRVSAEGGSTPVQFTTLDSTRHEGSHRWPSFLPDGKHILAMVRTRSESGDAEGDAVYAFSLDGKEKKMLVQSSFNAAYASGYLLFAQAGVLLAQKFDPVSLTLSGDPVKLQEGLLTDISYNIAVFTASLTGELITQTGESIAGARPIILDRAGKVIHTIEDRNEQDFPRYSPDGKEVVVYLYDLRSRRSNLWAYDLRTDTRRRLTTGATGEFNPVWSADGRSVYYTAGGVTEANQIFVTSATRSGEERPFTKISKLNTPTDVTLDGKWVLVETDSDSGTQTDIYCMPTSGGTAVPFRRTRFREEGARLSPDGRWVAYTSDESGDKEIYLLPFADPASTPVKISSGGGQVPEWGATSAELVYVNPRGQLVAAALRYAQAGPEVVGVTPLFFLPPFTLSFELARDGKSIFITRSLEVRTFPPLALATNWQSILPK
jgi:Tol biopolymer transport system component